MSPLTPFVVKHAHPKLKPKHVNLNSLPHEIKFNMNNNNINVSWPQVISQYD